MTSDSVFRCRDVAQLAALLLFMPGASATTPQERSIFGASAPHQLRPGGAPVSVHRARLHGFLGDKADPKAVQAEYMKEVNSCVRSHRESGEPVNPPTAWPDVGLAQREDIYIALNRSIRYEQGVWFSVDQSDCSLSGKIVASATLKSSHGACEINLTEKTASGWCDAGGEASAPFQKKHPLPSLEAMLAPLKGMAANPANAEAVAVIEKAARANAPTGEHKVVLGVACDVWPFPTGGTMCLAPGGSFKPGDTTANVYYGGLLVELRAKPGYTLEAVEIRLDDSVGGDVFTPYVAPGFKVENTGPGW